MAMKCKKFYYEDKHGTQWYGELIIGTPNKIEVRRVDNNNLVTTLTPIISDWIDFGDPDFLEEIDPYVGNKYAELIKALRKRG